MFDIISLIKKVKKRTFSIIEPLESGEIVDGVFSLKDGDSNLFFVKKNDTVIAIDSGYKDSESREKEFEIMPFSKEDVSAILLTHIDSDHAGCLYESGVSFYKNALIYLPEAEKIHLTKQKPRVKLGPLKIMHKLEVTKKVSLVKNEDCFFIGDIKIQPVFTPGHTLGHTCYLIEDKYLFTGDSIVLKEGEGYRFFDLLGFDNNQNSKSLQKLERVARNKGCKYIFTSHTGYSSSIDEAFKHCDRKFING